MAPGHDALATACDAITTVSTRAGHRAIATGAAGPGTGRGGAGSAGSGGATGAAVAAVAAVARVGRGVTTATGVGVAAPTAVATVGRLTATGLDAAAVLGVATGRRVVALTVGLHRGGVAAVGVLVDVALGLVGGVDVDSVSFAVDRAAVVPDELVLPPVMPPEVAAPVLDEALWLWEVSVVAGVDVPPAPPAPLPPIAVPPLAVAGPDVATPVWTTVAFWIDAWTFALRESLLNP